jgi:hypothetical protein
MEQWLACLWRKSLQVVFVVIPLRHYMSNHLASLQDADLRSLTLLRACLSILSLVSLRVRQLLMQRRQLLVAVQVAAATAAVAAVAAAALAEAALAEAAAQAVAAGVALSSLKSHTFQTFH